MTADPPHFRARAGQSRFDSTSRRAKRLCTGLPAPNALWLRAQRDDRERRRTMVMFLLWVFMITLTPWALALTLRLFFVSKDGLISATRALSARLDRRALGCDAS